MPSYVAPAAAGSAWHNSVPLTNVHLPLAPIPPAQVTEADIYVDGVVIYAGDQPVIAIDPASAVKFAEKVLEVYRAAGRQGVN